MLLDWSDDYLIGIDKVDEQHKEIFAIVHRFIEECLVCEGENVVPETLEFLRNYAVEHFQAEETLMKKHAYPGIEGHLMLHAKFLDKYAEFIEEFNEVGTSQELAEQTAEMVQNWLVDHIAEADVQYAAHVKKSA